MNADYRKGKQMYDKKLQSFNLRSSAIIRVSSDKYYSVLLCGEFCSFLIRKHYLCILKSNTEQKDGL